MNPTELLGAMKRTVEQLAAFNQIAKALTSTLEATEVLELVMQKVGELLQPQSWSLLLKGDDGELYFEICVGPAAQKLKELKVQVREGIAGAVFRTGKGRLVNDVRSDPDFAPRFDDSADFHTESIIAVPLICRGKALGIIELVNGKEAPPFTPDDLRAATAIADYAAIAIENARNFAKVQELTLIDEHTGLYNSRYLQATLQKEMERAGRFARPISLLFLDVDKFKSINDTHGHLVGSQVLKEVGKCLTESIRSVDSACRYGGDEFAVLLLETNSERARVVANRILTRINEKPFEVEGAKVQVSTSIGLAGFPDHGKTARELLAAADRGMYAAKAAGKNCVREAAPNLL